jgi:hypothetical protein
MMKAPWLVALLLAAALPGFAQAPAPTEPPADPPAATDPSDEAKEGTTEAPKKDDAPKNVLGADGLGSGVNKALRDGTAVKVETKPDANPRLAPKAAPVAKETICNDGIDNDGDSVFDCGDSDCADEPYCQPDGKPETGPARCSDWIDNDKDGLIDCEDQECFNSSVCKGSWKGPLSGDGGNTNSAGPGGDVEAPDGDPAALNRAYNGDVEQPDSEDGVGFVGIRFGVVAAIQETFTTTNLNDATEYQQRLDTRFDTLQLRAFGSLPLLEDSFFLLSVAAAQSPRITFAMFQFPLGEGHYINMNTGGGTLSAQPLVSAAKRPLLDNPNYLRNPFDQFLDAGVEINGPIVLNRLKYRVFAGGGTGLFGNFGGRRFEDASINPTYSAGTQLNFTAVGIYNRFDSPFLYRSVPTAAAFSLGAKYEQRERERFPAAHGMAVFRTGIFAAQFESYNKAELNYGALQTANYLQVGVLAIPELIFLAADVGHFYTSDFGQLTTLTKIPIAGELSDIPNSIRRQQNQLQARAAVHWYFWRQNGVMTLRYTFDQADPVPLGPQRDRTFPVISHEGVLQAQIRF